MATILAFPTTARGQPRRTQRPLPANTSAEIVFFPGVRYERWLSDQPSAKRRKRTPRRDRIELEA
jgi:hypothetical protein